MAGQNAALLLCSPTPCLAAGAALAYASAAGISLLVANEFTSTGLWVADGLALVLIVRAGRTARAAVAGSMIGAGLAVHLIAGLALVDAITAMAVHAAQVALFAAALLVLLRDRSTTIDGGRERDAVASHRSGGDHDRDSRWRDRGQVAIDAAGIGLFEVAARGRSLWWNEHMHDLYGTDQHRFAPTLKAWQQLIHPDDLDRVMDAAARALGGSAKVEIEYRIVRPDGEVRTIRAYARWRRGVNATPRLVGANWDVTAERQAVERLKLANDHMTQFAAIASHDLQAPLRQIALWADILQQDAGDALPPDAREVLDRIQRRARQMRQMVAGLLEFSSIGGSLRLEPIDLTRIATEAIADHSAELVEVGASAVVEPLPKAMGDPVMMSQLFGNLISNAIKYRSASPLQLIISGHVEPGAVVVTVRDNGIGIHPGYAGAVFEIFRRLPEAVDREGSGIGLAVCRRIADAMGGEIALDSHATGGAIFHVRLKPVAARSRHTEFQHDIRSTAA